MRTGNDYGDSAVVQELTLQSRIFFSEVLVSAESALWLYHLWRWLGGPLVWS